MSSVDSAGSVTGRRRQYPSNAARQAAYRRRVAARDAALREAAGGTFAAAVDQIEALAARRVAEARAERDEHRSRREQAERAAASAAARLARVEAALARATSERDQARQEAHSARAELRKERAGLEQVHPRELETLHHELAVLALDLERLRAGEEVVEGSERSVDQASPGRGEVGRELAPSANRAHRRGKRQGRR